MILINVSSKIGNINCLEAFEVAVDENSDWIELATQDNRFVRKLNNNWTRHGNGDGDGYNVIYDNVSNPTRMYYQGNYTTRNFRYWRGDTKSNENIFRENDSDPSDDWTEDVNQLGRGGLRNWEFNKNGALFLASKRDASTATPGVPSIYKITSDESEWERIVDLPAAATHTAAIGTSVSDADVLLMGMSKPMFGIPSDRLYRCLDATSSSSTVEDITGTIGTATNTPFPWLSGISDVIIDPTNSNNAWVCFGRNFQSGAQDNNRIFFTSNFREPTIDGGPTWHVIKNGLEFASGEPMPFPIHKMIYDDATGGIYIASDMGVFYNNNPTDITSTWECYNKDMPTCIVTDLKIDNCRRKLVASTFGRGLWEVDLAEEPNKEMEITSNTTWDGPLRKIINQSIRVKEGNTLTIKTELVLPSFAHIYVEKGAKLTIEGDVITQDGAAITTKCNELWQGIYVEGDNTEKQIPLSLQGYLLVTNGGTITNAKTAVNLVGLDASGNIDHTKSGGIVKATKAKFINNEQDVNFAGYRDSYTTGSSGKVYLKNQSTFTECSFLTNDLYKGNHNTLKTNIQMVGVLWIDIQGCTFTDGRWTNSINDALQLRDGISSYWASYRINRKFSFSPFGAMGYGQTNNFMNTRYAVTSYETKIPWFNLTVPKPSSVVDATFNSLGGVLYSGVDNAILSRNSLNVDYYYNSIGGPREIDAYGIFMDNCDGYQLEGNKVTGGWSQGSPYLESAGIVHTSNFSRLNTVYRNEMNDLMLGTEAFGKNKESILDNTAKGLQYRCNNFAETTDNLVDMYALQGNGQPVALANGLPQQGTLSSPAGNEFGRYPAGSNFHFYNTSNLTTVDYYHHDASSSTRVVPVERVNVTNEPTSIDLNRQENCPDETQQSITIGVAEQENVTETRFVLKEKRTLKDGLIDNGYTPGILNEIATVTVASTPQLISDLTTYSPYLSVDVLVALAQANAPITHLHIRDILVLNPHSGRSALVVATLQNRVDPLPASYMATIDSASQYYTSRDTLYDDIYSLTLSYETGLNQIIRKALNSESEDMFASITEPFLLAGLAPHRWYKLASLYDVRGREQDATDLLAQLPDQFILSAEEESYYNDFLELRGQAIAWQSVGKTPTQLNATDLATLLPYATKTNGIQNEVIPLLVLNNATTYLPPIYRLDNSSVAVRVAKPSAEVDRIPIENTIAEEVNHPERSQRVDLVLYPNPTQRVLHVAYTIGASTEARVAVVDLQGKVVYEQKLQENSTEIAIDVSTYRNGTYIIKLYADKENLITKTFSVAR